MELTAHKEYLLHLLNGVLDGHLKHNGKGPVYRDGIKHVRQLLDTSFEAKISEDELTEFCVGLICSLQPQHPKFNRYLSELEQGILAAAYFLYTAIHPLQYAGSREE